MYGKLIIFVSCFRFSLVLTCATIQTVLNTGEQVVASVKAGGVSGRNHHSQSCQENLKTMENDKGHTRKTKEKINACTQKILSNINE